MTAPRPDPPDPASSVSTETRAELLDLLSERDEALADILRDLRTAANLSIAELVAAREASERSEQASTRAGRLSTHTAVTVGASVVAVVAALILGWVVHQDTSRVMDALTECTTPGHDCHDARESRAAQQTSDRLGPIVAALCEAVPPERRRPPCPTG